MSLSLCAPEPVECPRVGIHAGVRACVRALVRACALLALCTAGKVETVTDSGTSHTTCRHTPDTRQLCVCCVLCKTMSPLLGVQQGLNLNPEQ